VIYYVFPFAESVWTFAALFVVYAIPFALTEGAEKAWVADFAGEAKGRAFGVYYLARALHSGRNRALRTSLRRVSPTRPSTSGGDRTGFRGIAFGTVERPSQRLLPPDSGARLSGVRVSERRTGQQAVSEVQALRGLPLRPVGASVGERPR